jgi:hypothetical protein
MATNQISFTLGQGGLGRPLPGTDHYSGFAFGLSTIGATKLFKCSSVDDAKANGINNDFADETQATATIQITGAGAAGDIITVNVVEPNKTVTVASYTVKATDTTAALIATGLKNAITDASFINGYTATSATDTVTLKARKGLGTYLNAATKLTATVTGTVTRVVTDFTGGVASLIAPIYYHISEFFRINPQGILFCGGFVTLAADGSDIDTVQNFAQGEVKQILFFEPLVNFATSKITTLQAVANRMLAQKQPLQIVYACNFNGTSLASLTNLNAQLGTSVSVCIAQDGGGKGYELAKGSAKSITAGGAMLGAISLAKVHEDIAWVGSFNMSNGIELEVLAFANGDMYSATSKATINTLNDYRYVFLLEQRGTAGSYWNDSHNACTQASDYAYIESNRTIYKAIRAINVALTPLLNSPLDINADGTLTDVSIEVFTTEVNRVLNELKIAGNLSAFSCTIDPEQNVLSTSSLNISVLLIPKGVARNINVKIGYTLKIA